MHTALGSRRRRSHGGSSKWREGGSSVGFAGRAAEAAGAGRPPHLQQRARGRHVRNNGLGWPLVAGTYSPCSKARATNPRQACSPREATKQTLVGRKRGEQQTADRRRKNCAPVARESLTTKMQVQCFSAQTSRVAACGCASQEVGPCQRYRWQYCLILPQFSSPEFA